MNSAVTTPATTYAIVEGAAWVTLNRPENRNALSAQLVNELYERLIAANADAAVRAIVITGAGPAFCAGADLKNPPGQASAGERAVTMADLLNAIMDSPKPVIAAVNGAAFAGGIGIVGACDIVVTAEEAMFSFSEVRIGVIPAIISVVCIPKLGKHTAMRLFLTGDRFTGAQAVDLGLAHKSAPVSELRAAVQAEIDLIRLGGPLAVQECKKLVRRISSIPMQDGFAETPDWSARVFRSKEAAEGIAAFREKRKPGWATSSQD